MIAQEKTTRSLESFGARCVVILTWIGFSTPVFAAEKSGVTLPDSVTVGGETLVLNGLGVREATLFNIDVYVAGLYLPAKTSNAEQIINGDYAKQIHMHFVRDVDRDKITGAYEESFEDHGDLQAQAEKLKELTRWMRDIQEGETMTLTYEPGKGTSVSVGGALQGTIRGFDFAQALWRVWLGAEPPNRGLKEGMLGAP